LFEVTDLLVDNSAAHIKHHFIALYHRTVSLPACAVYATANPSVCLSVCTSVRPFVRFSVVYIWRPTALHRVKTAKHISSPDSDIIIFERTNERERYFLTIQTVLFNLVQHYW